jgi:hypothetical protein
MRLLPGSEWQAAANAAELDAMGEWGCATPPCKELAPAELPCSVDESRVLLAPPTRLGVLLLPAKGPFPTATTDVPRAKVTPVAPILSMLLSTIATIAALMLRRGVVRNLCRNILYAFSSYMFVSETDMLTRQTR